MLSSSQSKAWHRRKANKCQPLPLIIFILPVCSSRVLKWAQFFERARIPLRPKAHRAELAVAHRPPAPQAAASSWSQSSRIKCLLKNFSSSPRSPQSPQTPFPGGERSQSLAFKDCPLLAASQTPMNTPLPRLAAQRTLTYLPPALGAQHSPVPTGLLSPVLLQGPGLSHRLVENQMCAGGQGNRHTQTPLVAPWTDKPFRAGNLAISTNVWNAHAFRPSSSTSKEFTPQA